MQIFFLKRTPFLAFFFAFVPWAYFGAPGMPTRAYGADGGQPRVISGGGTGGATPAVDTGTPAPAPAPSPAAAAVAPAPGTPAAVRASPDSSQGAATNRTDKKNRNRIRRSLFGDDGFYVDAGILIGNARPSIPGATTTPFLLQAGLNTTVAYRLFSFFLDTERVSISLGLMPDFRFSGQYSTIDPAIGNFRATRFQWLTPTVMARIEEEWTIKLGVELSGPYDLSRPTFNGNSLDLGSPFGVSLSGLYSLAKVFRLPNLYGGLQIEYATFGTLEDSSLGSSTLSSPVKFLEFGLAVNYAF